MPASQPGALGAPTLIEVWAPQCAVCRAIDPHLLAAAAAHPTVELVRVDATADPEHARSLGAKGTPTLIGLLGGEEVFRHVGRMGPDGLDDLFGSLAERSTPPSPTTTPWLRASAGTVLAGAGALTGPSWPLIALGLCIALWGAVPLLQRSR